MLYVMMMTGEFVKGTRRTVYRIAREEYSSIFRLCTSKLVIINDYDMADLAGRTVLQREVDHTLIICVRKINIDRRLRRAGRRPRISFIVRTRPALIMPLAVAADVVPEPRQIAAAKERTIATAYVS